jgi:predicted DNA-binding transcriptional regulator AlpA
MKAKRRPRDARRRVKIRTDTHPHLNGDDRLVRQDYVLARVPVSPKVLEAMIRRGRFPPGERIAPHVRVWRKLDVDAVVAHGGRYTPPE